MNWKETYTKIFLKQADIAISEATLKQYMPHMVAKYLKKHWWFKANPTMASIFT